MHSLPFSAYNKLMKQFLPLTLLFLLLGLTANAQSRDKQLTIEVTSVEGDNLKGQTLTLTQTDFQASYGTLKLDAAGKCSLKVYAGNHLLELNRGGFNPVSYQFTISDDETGKDIKIELTEKTRQPFALTTETEHDIFTGKNTISLSWNTEEPAFFDDFESYDDFAVSFGQWTGIDADLEAAAPLVGSYPNRGVMQYAQIINPLTVDPTWWYDYPILRPYDGKQYVGFTRTSSGNANDDWLISPAITVGTDNVLSFMGKAADQFPERFMVYVTTKLDNPTQGDFVRIDQGNYESADYKSWKEYTYDLSAYAGQQIKFAIRYISHYNQYGSFMLMIDNVFVGQNTTAAANPNEQFNIYLDGQLVATTRDCSYVFTDIENGPHTIGVQAIYLKAQSNTTSIEANIPIDNYSHVVFNVTTNSILKADGQHLTLTNSETLTSYDLTVANGKVEIASLPKGTYLALIEEGAFQRYQQTFDIQSDKNVDITLSDNLLKPYNITATLNEQDATYTLRWNQELVFTDSFEDYADFATGTFGEWKSIDRDGNPVYPVALGSQSNIVSFPGSGTASKPTAIAPMVFNPWKTSPAMLPNDPVIAAPTGDKTVIFFSAQQTKNDKWLISPLIDIHDNYTMSVKMKAYTSMYPETMELCLSSGSDNPDDFVPVSIAENIPDQWSLYQLDLASYAGNSIRVGFHYISTDAFMLQIDDFTVSPEDGQGEVVDYGNVVRFEISVDGTKIGESQTPSFIIPVLSAGSHTIGIKAIYKSGESEVATYEVEGTAGITLNTIDSTSTTAVYSLSGTYMGQNALQLPSGVYLVKRNGKTIKIRK